MAKPTTEFAVTPHATGATELSDGRRIGWAEFGDPGGDTVFWFHGTPGARTQVPGGLHDEAVARRIRVIGVERPGTGDSTPYRYERVVDFVEDLRQVADDRDAERFAAVGLSGGGPYVLACAARLGDRMTTGVVLGGVAPVRGPDTVISHLVGLRLISPLIDRIQSPVSEQIGKAVRSLAPYGHPFLEAFFLLTWGDWLEMRSQTTTKHQLIADLVDAANRSGLRAPLHDLVLFGRDWGFELNDVTIPITFWGGTFDLIVPHLHAHRQYRRVRNATLRTVPGRGHFAGYTNPGEVLDAIREHWPVVRPVRRSKPAAQSTETAGSGPARTRSRSAQRR
jgi:pimeloyl-ACP methyl ester carboxylesterase